jgi:hypothetical protein
MSPAGGSKDPPEKNMTIKNKKGKKGKKKHSTDMTTPIFCSKCLNVSFVRDHPAQKCCPDCRALTKGTQRDETEDMELEEVSGDEYETVSEADESSDESPESIEKLKAELAKRAQQVKDLEKQVIELKLIIANKFINEQFANQSQSNPQSQRNPRRLPREDLECRKAAVRKCGEGHLPNRQISYTGANFENERTSERGKCKNPNR